MEKQLEVEKYEDTYEDCCKKLDDLTVQQLDLIEEQLTLAAKLENIMKNGFIEMAKSRYIIGEKAVSITQLPGEESCVEPQTYINHDSQNRLCLEKSKNGKNPLKWFGVLVPTSLKESQRAFQGALEIVVDLVNTRNEWLDSLKSAQEVADKKKCDSKKEQSSN